MSDSQTETEGADVYEFVDAEEHVDELYDELVGDKYAVLQARDYPPGEAPVNWFVRMVRDEQSREAPGPEFIAYNPVNESFSASNEDSVKGFIEAVESARIISLCDAPWWGDGSAFEEVSGTNV